jgi:hypothetical protein
MWGNHLVTQADGGSGPEWRRRVGGGDPLEAAAVVSSMEEE